MTSDNSVIKAAQDRFLGCLLGLAIGDALGTTLEFAAPGSFSPIDDIIGGGPFQLEPGQWTDDTSMAMCLAESLIKCRKFDPKDQMERYVRWWQEGYWSSTGKCFDIGNTIRAALDRYLTSGVVYAGSSDPYTAGNGSLMRLAPVPMFFAQRPEEAIYYAGQSSRTTHSAITAVDACRYFSGLLVGALLGEEKDDLLDCVYSPVPGYWELHPLVEEILNVAIGSFRTKIPPEIRGTGYVVKSLEAALWAFYRTDNFHDGCLLAANLGEDADTTAAIYGQIAGATYGLSSIPASWLDKLAYSPEIKELANQLYHSSISESQNW